MWYRRRAAGRAESKCGFKWQGHSLPNITHEMMSKTWKIHKHTRVSSRYYDFGLRVDFVCVFNFYIENVSSELQIFW
jgi:hypothetical protein